MKNRRPKFAAIVLTTVAAMVAGSPLSAQDKRAGCPVLQIQFPDEMAQPQSKFVISANIDGLSETAKFIWGLSAGKIVAGQYSRKIEVLLGKETGATNVTIFLTVEGLAPDCPNTVSDVFPVAAPEIIDYPDGYSGLDPLEVRSQVDDFFVLLKNYPDTEGLIVLRYSENETDERLLKRVRQVLEAVRFRNYDITRLSFVVPEEPSISETNFRISSDDLDFNEQFGPSAVFKGEDIIRDSKKVLGRKIYRFRRQFQ